MDSDIYSLNKVCYDFINLTKLRIVDFLWDSDPIAQCLCHVPYCRSCFFTYVTCDDVISKRHSFLILNLIELKGNSGGFSPNMAIL